LSLHNRLKLKISSALLIPFIAVTYFCIALVSLKLSFSTSNATPVWPPSGFAFAMMLLFGYRIAPGILIGAFVVNIVTFLGNNICDTTTAIWASLLIGAGNTGEALAGNYLVKKFVKGENLFLNVGSIARFVCIALVMSLVSANIGADTVFLADIITPEIYPTVWLTWWTGDVTGILVITPLLLSWLQYKPRVKETNRKKILELAALYLVLFFFSLVMFVYWQPSNPFARGYMAIPILLWAALRFDLRETLTGVTILAGVAVWGTLHGKGGFASAYMNLSLLSLQTYFAVVTVTMLVLNISITGRKRTEETLQKAHDELEVRVKKRTGELTISNFKLEEAQRLAHIGSWEWDVVKDTISWSDELYKIFGQPNEMKPSFDVFLALVHPDDRAFVNDMIQQAYADHKPFNFYHRIIRPDGLVRVIHGQGEVFTGNNKVTIKMAGTGQDVTERKNAEDMLRKTTHELEQKNLELSNINAELASFSYVASHDLQEPLRKISSFTKLILDKEKFSPVGTNYFSRILSATQRMQHLIDSLLDYSRTNRIDVSFKEVDLDHVFNEVRKSFFEELNHAKASIMQDKLPVVYAIEAQMEQLFSNLLSNALKYRKVEELLSVTVSVQKVMGQDMRKLNADPETEYWKIEFSDSGIGFEQQYAQKIFELFQRLHGRTEYSGTGIGLAICKKIIENHKGFIAAHSIPGEGATFIIYLPCA
jgi:PAS domain S-box-containing protein